MLKPASIESSLTNFSMNQNKETTLCADSAPCVNNQEELTSNSDVDILECASNEPIAAVNNDPDATEYSSSFSGTFSGPYDDLKHEFSDAEVESKFAEPPLNFTGCNRVFEKKKLTDHWRRHIQPEIWRCKLLELWIKQLVAQAEKYDRQIEAYEHEKHCWREIDWPDNCTAREVPFESRNQNKVMRRKRRKASEGVADILHHVNQILLPYLEKKQGHEDFSTDPICSKQAEQDIKVHNDDLGFNFDWSMLKIKNHDSFLEQILFDVDALQLRVHELKSQLNNAICNSSVDIFSSPGMFIPGDPEYRPSLSPRCSPVNHGDGAPFEATSTPYASDFENEEKVIPGSADSSFVGASHTDIIESTVDLLAINLTHARHQIGNEVADDILINNQAAEEFHVYEIGHQKQQDAPEDDENLSIAHKTSSSETETDPEIASASERRPALKRSRQAAAEFHLRRSKRKRKMRRTSPGSWNGETWKRKQLKKH